MLLFAAPLQNGSEGISQDDTAHRDESIYCVILAAISSPFLPRSTYYNPESVRHIQGQEKGQSGSADQKQES
jgi:hypothetical protein